MLDVFIYILPFVGPPEKVTLSIPIHVNMHQSRLVFQTYMFTYNLSDICCNPDSYAHQMILSSTTVSGLMSLVCQALVHGTCTWHVVYDSKPCDHFLFCSSVKTVWTGHKMSQAYSFLISPTPRHPFIKKLFTSSKYWYIY